MNKMSDTSKIVIGAAIVVVIIVAIFIYGSRSTTPAPVQTVPSTTANASTTVASTTTGTNTGSPSTGTPGRVSHPTPVPPPVVITLITPVANDQWQIGATNPISWNPAGNFTGEIDLLDGTTHAFIGVILSQTGPQQTSYGWDTREYYLARYSPLAKEIVPGTYAIRIEFDGNNLPPIISPTFTIAN